MPKTFALTVILALVTHAAFAAESKKGSDGEIAIGWDKGDQGRISSLGNGGGHGLVPPLDEKVFAGPVTSKEFAGVQVALKLPKGSYDLECQVKHDPKAGEPTDLKFTVEARQAVGSGAWSKPFQPELERFKGPLYTVKTSVKVSNPSVENKWVFAASKTMRFKSCVVVAEGTHPTTSAAPRRASHR